MHLKSNKLTMDGCYQDIRKNLVKSVGIVVDIQCVHRDIVLVAEDRDRSVVRIFQNIFALEFQY